MSTPKVLVVDDDETVRGLLKARLSRTYGVLEADTGAEALALLDVEPVDLALVDVMMPGLSGIDVCLSMKQRPGPFLPVVLMSALNERHDRNAGLAAGADAYLSKPLDTVELSMCVRRLIELREKDVLVRRQLQELQRLTALKDDLTELFVHDLRNPLTSMLVALELVNRAHGLRDEDRELARLSQASGQRIRDTLEELLEISRLERGELSPSPAPVSLNALVAEAVATLRPVAVEARATVAVSAGEALEAEVDRKLLLRAIENLLANAIRHTRGSVEVSIARAGGEAIIAVWDRGPGVPDAFKDGVFEKYGSVALRRANLRRGFGLGLYAVRMVVQAHQGRVELDDREGGGAVFRLVLPLKAALPVLPATSDHGSAAT